MTTYIGDTDVADWPIRIFGGTVDDYNPDRGLQDVRRPPEVQLGTTSKSPNTRMLRTPSTIRSVTTRRSW